MYFSGGIYHYHYKADGCHAVSAVATSIDKAEDWIRSIYPPGTQVWIFWPSTATGSKYTKAITT